MKLQALAWAMWPALPAQFSATGLTMAQGAAPDSRVLRIAALLWSLLAILALLVVSFGLLTFLRRFGYRLRRRPSERKRATYPRRPQVTPILVTPLEKVPEEPIDIGQRFRRPHRLTRQREFDLVFGGRNSAAGRSLVVYGMPNRLGWSRLGLSVGRKYGNAVKRNRFKRLCREAFRCTREKQPEGWDWIILPITRRAKGEPKRGAKARRLRLKEIERDLLTLMSKIADRQGKGPENEFPR